MLAAAGGAGKSGPLTFAAARRLLLVRHGGQLALSGAARPRQRLLFTTRSEKAALSGLADSRVRKKKSRGGAVARRQPQSDGDVITSDSGGC